MLVKSNLNNLSIKALEIYPIELEKNNKKFNDAEDRIEEIYNIFKNNSPENKKLIIELEELESNRSTYLAEFLYKKGLKDGLALIKILNSF